MKTHTLVFKWDKNPDIDPNTKAKTTGYNIYYSHNPDALLPENFDYGKETSVRINQEDIPQPKEGDTVTYTYTNVPEGDFYFICTAHNQNGTESPPSNMVHQYVDYAAPSSPEGFKISITLTINREQ
jgi:plastocyanin